MGRVEQRACENCVYVHGIYSTPICLHAILLFNSPRRISVRIAKPSTWIKLLHFSHANYEYCHRLRLYCIDDKFRPTKMCSKRNHRHLGIGMMTYFFWDDFELDSNISNIFGKQTTECVTNQWEMCSRRMICISQYSYSCILHSLNAWRYELYSENRIYDGKRIT